MLEQGEFDVAVICTPDWLHRDQAVACLEAGKHVHLEKPLALSASDCNAIVDTAEGAVQLPQARRHALHLLAKPTHLEEHAPPHLHPVGLGEDETGARDVDPQCRSGGMVPELPSWLSAV